MFSLAFFEQRCQEVFSFSEGVVYSAGRIMVSICCFLSFWGNGLQKARCWLVSTLGPWVPRSMALPGSSPPERLLP